MSFAAIDDNMPEHPKVERLSDRAFRVYVTSICFCSRNLTDGLVLHAQAAKVGASPKVIRELVDAGRWEEDVEGWRVHNYLKWNQPREIVAERRDKARAAAQARWDAPGNAKRNASSNANRNASSNAKRNALLSSPLAASPPAPATAGARARDGDADFGRAVRAVEDMGGLLTPILAEKIGAELDEGTPAEWVEAACEEAAVNGARTWNYVEAILDRWRRDGFKSDRRRESANGTHDAGTDARDGAARTGGGGGGRAKPGASRRGRQPGDPF